MRTSAPRSPDSQQPAVPALPSATPCTRPAASSRVSAARAASRSCQVRECRQRARYSPATSISGPASLASAADSGSGGARSAGAEGRQAVGGAPQHCNLCRTVSRPTSTTGRDNSGGGGSSGPNMGPTCREAGRRRAGVAGWRRASRRPCRAATPPVDRCAGLVSVGEVVGSLGLRRPLIIAVPVCRARAGGRHHGPARGRWRRGKVATVCRRRCRCSPLHS